MPRPVRFYGLLHIQRGQSSSVNLKSENFNSGIDVYINCAMTLSRSLAQIGQQFTLLTNDKRHIESRLPASKTSLLNIREISFSYNVPSGAAFYSAHFKLDVFEHLAQLDTYSVFCDLDVIAVSKLPQEFISAIENDRSVYYEITDQVAPAYGAKIIADDLTRVHGHNSTGKWYGGEFLSGPPSFFRVLSDHCRRMFPNYVAHIRNLHHVGDEAIVSAAIEQMKAAGHQFTDAGEMLVIARYWNTPTIHRQPPIERYASYSMLHLPADKGFLSDLSALSDSSFKDPWDTYFRHTRTFSQRIRRLMRKAKSILK